MSYVTVYPRAKLMLVGMLILGFLMGRNFYTSGDGFSKYAALGILAIVVLNVAILTRRVVSPKPSVTLGEDYVISTKNKRYDASQIECVYMTYKRIGIKLYGRRLVPSDLCFYFESSQENAGLEELEEWTARNQKEVKHKFFQTLT
ncbi:hypothetical protein [Paenibacillus tundrae]|uniref:hypothetical protein n=1 Tax=Paenibacillus tundrae TaxID=528187 RepID=UPI0030D0C8D8